MAIDADACGRRFHVAVIEVDRERTFQTQLLAYACVLNGATFNPRIARGGSRVTAPKVIGSALTRQKLRLRIRMGIFGPPRSADYTPMH